MSYEVYTLGGGEYLYDIFNGVAAITKGSSYLTIIKISAIFGLFWGVAQSVIGNNFKSTATWFVSFMLLFNVMFVPKATILINDPLNPQAKIRQVANVPFALAMFASYTSSIGYHLTKEMESAFTPVDYQSYHKHGMLFGSKLLTLSNSMRIIDEDFASSINSFMKQCVFYDIKLRKYTIDELRDSKDIWSFLTVSNDQSPARAFEIYNKKTRSIVTCKAGSATLKSQWGDQIVKSVSFYENYLMGVEVTKGESEVKTKKLLLSHLPLSYSSLAGISSTATDLIKQNMMINAIDRAGNEFSNIGANGANIYMQVRAEMQTKAAYKATKSQAEEWVPTLRIVFEVLFYGAFPLIFLLCLLPVGPQIAKGYFLTFVWIQSWAPLYAILNRIMVGEIYSQTQGIVGKGLTMVTHGSIEAINHNVASIAGTISMSIPFIAFAMVRGAGAISGLATSMLAIPQMAASSAAAESSTGNLSLGNSNIDNSSFNNSSGNKMNNSAFFDNGRMQAINNTGGMTTITPDGRAVYDQTGSTSRIPNMSLSTNDTQSQTASLNASVAQSMGESESKQASFSKAQSMDMLAASMASHSINENNGIKFAENVSTNTKDAINRISARADDLSNSLAIDKSSAFKLALSGGIGMSGGGNGVFSAILPKISGGASIDGSLDSRKSEAYSSVSRITSSDQNLTDIGIISSAINDNSLELSDSNGVTLNNNFSQGYNESQRLEESSRAHFDEARSYTEQAQLLDSQSVQFTQDQIPEFIEYAKASTDADGNRLGERALSVIANDPVATEHLKNSYVSSKGIGGFSQNFASAKQALGVSDLNAQYQHSSNNIADPTSNFNSDQVIERHSDLVSDRRVDNSALRENTSDRIAANTNTIQNYQHDSAGLKNQIQEKLQDDAFVTRMKSFTSNAAPKSNFKNEE